jgi:DNA-binding Xre family transcriptional regulator
MIRIKLDLLLRARGLTQKDFAHMVELSENAVSTLVNQPAQIRLDTIEKICNVLSITPGDLFDYHKS